MTTVAEPTVTSLYDILFQKQIDAIFHATAKVNIWEGSIRSGKTMSSLIAWLLYVNSAPRGGELVMIGKTLQTIYRNLFLPMMDADLFGDFSKQVHYTQGAPTARILGRVIHIVGANDAKAESKIRGFTCAGAYVDEATLLPEDFWETLKGRMSVEGARLFATTNPDNPMHWLRQKEILSGSQHVRVFKFLLEDNIFLPPSYVEWAKETYKGLYYKRNILGLWVVAEGAVYDMWDEDKHVVDDAQMPAMRQWLGLGIDYGTTNPFAAVLLGLGMDNRLYVGAEWYYDSKTQQKQLTDSQYADRLQKWVKKPYPGYRDNDYLWWVVDPSAASFRVELKGRGIAQFGGDNSVIDGIRQMGSLIARDKFRVNRRCIHLRQEFPGYSWDDKAALLGEDKPIKVADHVLDATRYITKSTETTWSQYIRENAHAST